MRNLRPLLVTLPLVPGVLIGIWIGTGSGQGTAPPRPPADAVQQAQTPQAVPSTRPEQQKTPHDQQDPGKNAPRAAATETQPDKDQGLDSISRATREREAPHADQGLHRLVLVGSPGRAQALGRDRDVPHAGSHRDRVFRASGHAGHHGLAASERRPGGRRQIGLRRDVAR